MRFVRPGGQATIEAALVLPLMVFFALAILQLALVEHARLMTEYAAFQAARAGVVWNGSSERMHDAALFALLPTLGRTDGWPALAATWRRERWRGEALQALPWGAAPAEVNGQPLTGRVRVDTVSPSGEDAAAPELDFDGAPPPEQRAPGGDLERRQAADDAGWRRATLLQLRLRYWFELRVPFANHVVFLAWFAANADVALRGAIDRSTTARQNALGARGDAAGLEQQARGLPGVERGELLVLWSLASGARPLWGAPRRFFLPLQATHAMRLQSSFYEKWRVRR